MNIEALRGTAALIRKHQRFDMRYFLKGENDLDTAEPVADVLLHGCNTTGCVAGWGDAWLQLHDPDAWDALADTEATVARTAQQALDLTDEQAENLFFADPGSVWAGVAAEYGWETYHSGAVIEWDQIAADQAAEVLERIADGKLTL